MAELHSIPVYRSRFTPGLKPGDGADIGWEIGETVLICSGRDQGRRMVITSERMTHSGAPGEYVREGYFEDDPARTPFAKVERYLWMLDYSPIAVA